MNQYKADDNQKGNDDNKGLDSLTKSPRELFNKIFKKNRDDDDSKPKSITADMKKPHSIVDEVFSWVKRQQTREQILQRGQTSQHITTPKAVGRGLSPNISGSGDFKDSCFSPMTLSRNAVANNQNGDMTVSAWPIL